MNKRKTLIIITFIFNLFCITFIKATTISSSINRGLAYTGVASPHFSSVDQNPATLGFQKSYITGFYYAPDLGEVIPKLNDARLNQWGAFVVYPIPHVVLYTDFGAQTNNSFNSNFNFNSFSLGVGYEIIKGLSIGYHLAYFRSDSINYIEMNLGLQYSIYFDANLLWGFGLYDVTFGATWITSPLRFGLSRKEFISHSQWGVSFQMFRNKYFNIFFYNHIFVIGPFQEAIIQSGFKFQFTPYFELHYGFWSEEFLRHNSNLFAIQFMVPIKYVKWYFYTSFGDIPFNSTELRNFKISPHNDISFSSFININLNDYKKKIKTDDALVHYFEPKEIITPNSDNKNDFLKIFLVHQSYNEIYNWNLIIRNSKNNLVLTIQPNLQDRKENNLIDFPKILKWSGTNALDQLVDDDTYSFELTILTQEKEFKTWQLGTIRLDATDPDFKYTLFNNNFSYTDDQPITIELKDITGDIKFYNLSINDGNKNVFTRTINKNITNENKINWNGLYFGKQKLPESKYEVMIEAVDQVGNKLLQRGKYIYINNSQKLVLLNFPYFFFSPNNDSQFDNLIIQPIINSKFSKEVESWEINLLHIESSTIIKNFISESSLIPKEIIWDGLDTQNELAPEGEYRIRMEITLKNGRKIKSSAYLVALDNTPPEITISTRNNELSPDDDGINDFVKIDIQGSDENRIYAYKIKIRDDKIKLTKKLKTKVVLEKISKDELPIFYIWNGNLSTGVKVDSFAKYTAWIEAIDIAGNFSKSNEITIKTNLIKNTKITTPNLDVSTLLLRFPNITFKLGDAIPEPDSFEVIEKTISFFKKNERFRITIIGHADHIGDVVTNLRLSKQRASFLKKYLIEKGIDKDRLFTKGKGNGELLYDINDPFVNYKNRRVEFLLEDVSINKKSK